MSGERERAALTAAQARSGEELVRMRDGVRLATDIYLPRGAGPFPVVLTRTPYDKEAATSMLAPAAAHFNERGYALVAQDTRGKHRSEGELFAFTAEASDGYDTLEWLSAQRWCNGRIGMWGDSYCGFTQLAAAAGGHPALGAIVPANIAAQIDAWMYRQGVFELSLALPWAAATWVQRVHREIEAWDVDWTVRPLSEALPAVMDGRDSPSLRRWHTAPPGDPFWTRAIYRGHDPLAHAVPALHIGGWWDLFRHRQVLEWSQARGHSSAPRWLVMDATDHGWFEWSLQPPGIPAEQWWGSAETLSLLAAQTSLALDFFDRVLRGAGGPEPAPVRWRLTRVGWRESPSWPPPRAGPLCLHLVPGGADGDAGTSAGALALQAERHARWSTWVHDPEALVPSGERTPFMLLAEPPDDRSLSERPDVLELSSAPLAEPLDICGPVTAELLLGSTGPAMHAIARLLDVFADGRVRRICDGAAAVAMTAGDVRVTVALGDVGYRVASGHRLRLQIASSDFPRYLPYPGDERDPWDASGGVRNTQRLRLGGEHGSRLQLTVLGGAGDFEGECIRDGKAGRRTAGAEDERRARTAGTEDDR